jgi:hypothetical protein
MAISRIYPKKQNTIASGVFSSYNSGQNAVCDLWFGGGENSEQHLSISRHLMLFDLDSLRGKIESTEINTGLTVTYKLRMKNAIPLEKVLEQTGGYRKLKKAVASSYDLIAFPINKNWDDGRGVDIVKEHYLVKQQGDVPITGFSNWNSATLLSDWDEPGIFENPTASTTFSVSQHFSSGSEDIDMDITPLVNSWLSGEIENNGLAIAFRRDHELLTSDTRYIASFFTNKTNFAFKPFLEVSYDNQYILDDRMQMTNNRPGRLFLYTFSGNSACNYYSAGTVDIVSSNGQIVLSGITPQHLEKGVYFIDVFLPNSAKGQVYKDIWRGVTFNPPYDIQDIAQTFSIRDSYYSNAPQINDYSLDIYGIPNGGILTSDQVIRVGCDLRVNYSIKRPEKNYALKYRLIMNHQEEVIPWHMVNQVVLGNSPMNYFDLDTSWLLHNQTYALQFRVEEAGTSRIIPTDITFKVMRPF